MAHKKGQGSSRNGRESESKRLGIKAAEGQFVTTGSILVRQRGTKWHPGKFVRRAKDDSLFAMMDGFVSYRKSERTYVSIVPVVES